MTTTLHNSTGNVATAATAVSTTWPTVSAGDTAILLLSVSASITAPTITGFTLQATGSGSGTVVYVYARSTTDFKCTGAESGTISASWTGTRDAAIAVITISADNDQQGWLCFSDGRSVGAGGLSPTYTYSGIVGLTRADAIAEIARSVGSNYNTGGGTWSDTGSTTLFNASGSIILGPQNTLCDIAIANASSGADNPTGSPQAQVNINSSSAASIAAILMRPKPGIPKVKTFGPETTRRLAGLATHHQMAFAEPRIERTAVFFDGVDVDFAPRSRPFPTNEQLAFARPSEANTWLGKGVDTAFGQSPEAVPRARPGLPPRHQQASGQPSFLRTWIAPSAIGIRGFFPDFAPRVRPGLHARHQQDDAVPSDAKTWIGAGGGSGASSRAPTFTRTRAFPTRLQQADAEAPFQPPPPAVIQIQVVYPDRIVEPAFSSGQQLAFAAPIEEMPVPNPPQTWPDRVICPQYPASQQLAAGFAFIDQTLPEPGPEYPDRIVLPRLGPGSHQSTALVVPDQTVASEQPTFADRTPSARFPVQDHLFTSLVIPEAPVAGQPLPAFPERTRALRFVLAHQQDRGAPVALELAVAGEPAVIVDRTNSRPFPVGSQLDRGAPTTVEIQAAGEPGVFPDRVDARRFAVTEQQGQASPILDQPVPSPTETFSDRFPARRSPVPDSPGPAYQPAPAAPTWFESESPVAAKIRPSPPSIVVSPIEESPNPEPQSSFQDRIVGRSLPPHQQLAGATPILERPLPEPSVVTAERTVGRPFPVQTQFDPGRADVDQTVASEQPTFPDRVIVRPYPTASQQADARTSLDQPLPEPQPAFADRIVRRTILAASQQDRMTPLLDQPMPEPPLVFPERLVRRAVIAAQQDQVAPIEEQPLPNPPKTFPDRTVGRGFPTTEQLGAALAIPEQPNPEPGPVFPDRVAGRVVNTAQQQDRGAPILEQQLPEPSSIFRDPVARAGRTPEQLGLTLVVAAPVVPFGAAYPDRIPPRVLAVFGAAAPVPVATTWAPVWMEAELPPSPRRPIPQQGGPGAGVSATPGANYTFVDGVVVSSTRRLSAPTAQPVTALPPTTYAPTWSEAEIPIPRARSVSSTTNVQTPVLPPSLPPSSNVFMAVRVPMVREGFEVTPIREQREAGEQQPIFPDTTRLPRIREGFTGTPILDLKVAGEPGMFPDATRARRIREGVVAFPQIEEKTAGESVYPSATRAPRIREGLSAEPVLDSSTPDLLPVYPDTTRAPRIREGLTETYYYFPPAPTVGFVVAPEMTRRLQPAIVEASFSPILVRGEVIQVAAWPPRLLESRVLEASTLLGSTQRPVLRAAATMAPRMGPGVVIPVASGAASRVLARLLSSRVRR